MPSDRSTTTSTTQQIVLPAFHPAQTRIARSKARFKVVAAGRQSGKTSYAAIETVYKAVNNNAECWWLAPDYKRLEPGWILLKKLVRDMPGVEIREGDMEIIFPDGGYIQCRNTEKDYASLKGRTLDHCVLDEAAYMRPEVWHESVRYTLMIRQGTATFISSTNGHNWFWELFNQAENDTTGMYQAFRMTGWENPYMPRAELEENQRNSMRFTYLQEVMAEFIDDFGAVFENIKACAVLQPADAPLPSHSYVVGLDWGHSHDPSIMVVVDASENRQVHLYELKESNWTAMRTWVESLCAYWKPMKLVVEDNGAGDVNIEEMRKLNLPIDAFNTNSETKRALIDSWRLAIARLECWMLNDAKLISEHLSFQSSLTPTGHIRFSAPKGMHDDTVMASALAWYGVVGYRQKPEGFLNVLRARGLWGSGIKDKTRTYPTWTKQNRSAPRV